MRRSRDAAFTAVPYRAGRQRFRQSQQRPAGSAPDEPPILPPFGPSRGRVRGLKWTPISQRLHRPVESISVSLNSRDRGMVEQAESSGPVRVFIWRQEKGRSPGVPLWKAVFSASCPRSWPLGLPSDARSSWFPPRAALCGLLHGFSGWARVVLCPRSPRGFGIWVVAGTHTPGISPSAVRGTT